MHSRDVDISDMRGESLQCVYCSYERRCRHVHVRCGEWVYMSAYMYRRVHGIWSIEVHVRYVDIRDMHRESLLRSSSSCEWRCWYLYSELAEWVYMSAYM